MHGLLDAQAGDARLMSHLRASRDTLVSCPGRMRLTSLLAPSTRNAASNVPATSPNIFVRMQSFPAYTISTIRSTSRRVRQQDKQLSTSNHNTGDFRNFFELPTSSCSCTPGASECADPAYSMSALGTADIIEALTEDIPKDIVSETPSNANRERRLTWKFLSLFVKGLKRRQYPTAQADPRGAV